MRHSLPRFGATVGLIICAFSANAQSDAPAPQAPELERSAYFSAMLKGVDPDSDRDADFGFGAHLHYGSPLSDRFAWELGISGADLKRESNSDEDDFYYTLGPDLLFAFREDSFKRNIFTPFALAGIGLFHDDTARVRDDSAYVNIGLGLLIPVTENRLRIRLEARNYWVFDDDAPSEGLQTAPQPVTDDDFSEFHVNLGLQWSFAPNIVVQNTRVAAADSDGDGVVDSGAVVSAADAASGVVVVGSGDQCPNTPQGVPVDATGCPADDDGDGVINYYDHCPATPPGTEVDHLGCAKTTACDATGQCPDSCEGDCDKDGVKNRMDHCPGTLPGLTVDARGCVVKAQRLVLAGVNFDFNKSSLTGPSKVILNQAAEAMLGQPSMRVRIEGHTDAIASDKYNLWLSDRRAASVRRYLISKGVDASRLDSKGYGESQPIATNDTKEGRAKNRRVEFVVLK